MLEAQTISSACAHTSQSAISFTCSINIASFHLRSLSACSLTSTGAVPLGHLDTDWVGFISLQLDSKL